MRIHFICINIATVIYPCHLVRPPYNHHQSPNVVVQYLLFVVLSSLHCHYHSTILHYHPQQQLNLQSWERCFIAATQDKSHTNRNYCAITTLRNNNLAQYTDKEEQSTISTCFIYLDGDSSSSSPPLVNYHWQSIRSCRQIVHRLVIQHTCTNPPINTCAAISYFISFLYMDTQLPIFHLLQSFREALFFNYNILPYLSFIIYLSSFIFHHLSFIIYLSSFVFILVYKNTKWD